LVRHGDADAEIPEGLDDDARALTCRSRLSLPGHFKSVAERIGIPDVILMSPLVRAVQTATILAQVLGYEGPLKANRALFPNGPVGAIEGLLQNHPGATVVLVGHQPSVGAVATHFLGEAVVPKVVTPGTIIGIDRPDETIPNGALLFFAAPGQIIVD
jgi:phosphohistidine phosphatase